MSIDSFLSETLSGGRVIGQSEKLTDVGAADNVHVGRGENTFADIFVERERRGERRTSSSSCCGRCIDFYNISEAGRSSARKICKIIPTGTSDVRRPGRLFMTIFSDMRRLKRATRTPCIERKNCCLALFRPRGCRPIKISPAGLKGEMRLPATAIRSQIRLFHQRAEMVTFWQSPVSSRPIWPTDATRITSAPTVCFFWGKGKNVSVDELTGSIRSGMFSTFSNQVHPRTCATTPLVAVG